MMNRILEGLNSAQKEAVECLGGPLLIIAGAGSGKTKTLTHRIANLIAHGVQPNRILAVTFTNKAAKEMRNRLYNLLWSHSRDGSLAPAVAGLAPSSSVVTSGSPRIESIKDSNDLFSSGPELDISIQNITPQDPPRNFMPYMGTFHSICVKILRIEADAAGLDRNFVIYDTDDQISLIRRTMKELHLNENKALRPKSVQSIISSEKNQGNGPDEYAAKALYQNQKDIAKIFRRYEEEKRQAAALDFDDLLLKTLELFSKNVEVREKWKEKFQHILIDEYQDTNTVQYQLVKLLVGKERNICVVGDDWQSIYSWRGADFTNILNFEHDFPGAKVIKLEQNYRSTGNILTASQKIITQNKTRTDKKLFTESGDGEPVEIENLADETAEAEYVARKIMLLTREYRNYSDFAVLYRTNAQSYAFEKAMISRQIPYKIVGGVRFYDRKEIKDIIAILRLIINERDKVSFERVAKNVLSGFGEVSLRKMIDAIDAIKGDMPLMDEDLSDALSSAKARSSLMRLINFLRQNISDQKTVDDNVEIRPDEIVRRAVEYFDFKTLVDDGTPSSEERLKNLEVLASIAAEHETLEDFLADASLMSSADESVGKNSVTLMTLHAAKGLEFPVVFVVGLEEGLFPGARAYDSENDLEEERRLMYVGMTRAMKRLFLTFASSRYAFGSRNYSIPSRFLTELGYNPYGSSSYRDKDGDGFTDFSEDDFVDDPFPEDLPVWE